MIQPLVVDALEANLGGMVSDRAKRLKEATHATHDRLDKSITAHKPFESQARYGHFVKVQHQFHREIDALYENPVLDKLLPDLARRRRFPLIEQDLADLRMTAPSSDASPIFASSADVDLPTALGWLYVAEGSNLGAAFLLKEPQKLGLLQRRRRGAACIGRPSPPRLTV
jgi:heme oxygenase